MPNRKHHENDKLIIYTGDGDEIVDTKVKQQFNLLLSEEYGWYLPRVQPIPVYEWRDPDQRPIATHRVFAIARETPDPAQSFRFVNETIIAFYRAASRNQTAQQAETDRKGFKVRAAIAIAITVLFIFCITAMPILFRPAIIIDENEIDAPPVVAPTAVPVTPPPSGLIPVDGQGVGR